MDLTGASWGAFEVWGPFSEGGMSRVWLARHRELAAPVVLKTLLEVQDAAEALGRLRAEARLMARIPSPRVVRPVDVGAVEGGPLGRIPYLAQEYVDGLDLAELDHRRRVALGRGLPLWYVCHAVSEIAEALHSAHQTGVLHRDVKPSNMFGSPQTGIRLGDFGIAQARRAEGSSPGGTLRFLAPEALRGEPPTRRCDVYSLGATAHDLYYGTPPFTALAEILADTKVSFPAARSPQEAYFQHVLGRMLERDPEQRFPSMSAPLRQLAALARDLRPPPAPPSAQAVWLGQDAFQVGHVQIRCVMGDIAEVVAEGIVNSAVDEMTMRAGVSDALRRRGGQEIEDEAMRGGRRALGECVATGGGALDCRRVLHAVSAWKEASCIGRASQRALLLAEELGLRTLAIPALGTGRAQVAPEASAYAIGAALQEHLVLGGSRLREVTFVLWDREMRELF
ncbi:MAG TPA: serine/threonine-protein kinase, partial [Candidatus Nanopelagicales bacterium]|nr:serine/threonine-protein kinase [Candidatus Nanopelagicales bacterium]